MKSTIVKRILLITALIIFIAGIVFLVLILRTPEPPSKEIEDARKAILEAQKAGADQYALLQFKKAQVSYDSAMYYFRRENEKIFFKRNFDLCTKNAVSSAKNAKEAKKAAIAISRNFKSYLETKIDSLDDFLNHFKDIFIKLPLDTYVFNDYTKGKILLTESKYAFENSNLFSCNKKIDLAFEHISKAYDVAKLLLNNYFRFYPEWMSWADETINYSKSNKTNAIIVDKFSKKAYLYESGVLKFSTDIELGKNWIGFKKFNGDKATPEGKYTIIKKKVDPHTKYYKALLLDYPNIDDKKRFQEARKKGLIPKNKDIGNMIEIHGGGGQGANWTDGCVALKNSDIDKIYNMISEGTPVTIVGSLLSLSEILNNNVL
ncbi:MAG TPA: hypothetical protein DCQ24_07850 [Bacteroidales bacterium]|nr:hypothetical protein [Bacteroidales bacterium]